MIVSFDLTEKEVLDILRQHFQQRTALPLINEQVIVYTNKTFQVRYLVEVQTAEGVAA